MSPTTPQPVLRFLGKIVKDGNSLAIRVPSTLGVAPGDEVEVSLSAPGPRSPAEQAESTLQQLRRQSVNPEVQRALDIAVGVLQSNQEAGRRRLGDFFHRCHLRDETRMNWAFGYMNSHGLLNSFVDFLEGWERAGVFEDGDPEPAPAPPLKFSEHAGELERILWPEMMADLGFGSSEAEVTLRNP